MADPTAISIAINGVNNLSGPVGGAISSLNSLESTAGKIGGAMVGIAETALKAAAAVTALGVATAAGFTASSVKVAADFQQQISAISAVSSKAQVDAVGGMKAISDAALELGKATSFTATQAAAGMEEMVKAGVSLQDVMGGGAKAALDLAAAGALSVSEAATVASNAMNAFALSGKDLPHIADALANAANASATDVHQLGFALAAVGAVAHTIGFSFDDTTTAIALFANAGLKGSDAGTSLKTMLLNLSPSTKTATKEMQALGIITEDGSNKFFDAQGNVKSMAEVAGVLQTATANLTKEQKINALQTIFGTDAIRAAAIMAEQGAAGFDAMTQAQKEVGGASAVAKERLNNLKGALEQLGGSWEVIRIKMGSPFLPILTKAALALTDALNKAEPSITAFAERAAAGLDRLIARAQAAGPRFLAMGAGLMAFGRQGLTLAQGALPALIAGFDKLKTFIGGLSLGGIASGASSLLGGLLDSFKQIEPVVMSVGRAVVSNITETFNFLTTRVLPPLVSIVQQIGGVLERTLLPAAAKTGATMRGIFGDTLDWLAKTVMPPFLSIVEQTSDLFTGKILPTLPGIAASLRTTLGETIQWLANDVWPKLTVAAGIAWTFISEKIAPALPGIAAQIRSVLGGALEWIGTTGWPMLVQGATVAWAFLNDKIIPVVKDTYAWLKEKLPEAIATVTGAWETIKGKVGPIIEAALSGDIKGAIGKLGTAFSEFGTLAMGWLKEQAAKIDWAAIWAATKDIASELATYVQKQAVDFAVWLGEQVAKIDWATVWSQTKDVATQLGTYLASQAVDFATWLGEQVAKVDWAAVWAQAKDVGVKLGEYLAGQAADFATWLSTQAAAVDWAAVWAQSKEVAATLLTYVSGLTVDFSTWLGTQVAAIKWEEVWAQSKLTGQMVVEAIWAKVTVLDQLLTDKINETVAAIDWFGVGEQFGASLAGSITEGTTSAGAKLDVGAIGAALGNVLLGIFKGIFGTSLQQAWAEAWKDFWATGPLPGATIVPGQFPGGAQMPSPGGGSSNQSARPVLQSVNSGDLGAIDNTSRDSFVRTAFPWALQEAFGNVARANQAIAIAISENGDIGTGKDLSQTGFNFGGVHAQPGEPSFQGFDAGRPTAFRAYDNPGQGLNSFMDFLESNPRYAPALERYRQTGDIDQLTQDANNAGYSETPTWPSNIRNIRQQQVEPITANLPSRTNMVNQVGNATKPPANMGTFGQSQAIGNQYEMGLSPADAAAACGPAAAALFMQATGRTPNGQEVLRIASLNGWTRSDGMGGVGAFQKTLSDLGVESALLPSTGAAAAESVQSGHLTAISTGMHYNVAQGFDPATGKFDLGETGGPDPTNPDAQHALKGGSRFMTAQEITDMQGPINGVIQLTDTWTASNAAAATSLPPVAAGAQAVGEKTAEAAPGITATNDALGAVPAVADAAGASTATAAETVQVSFDTMAAGALTSVTNMGTGVLTTTQDMAGNTIATITDMSGQVTSQSATLASGVSLSMADMGVQTTSSVNAMAGTITTVMTDTAGNAVTTTTDMSGQVVGQFATMSTTAGSAVTQLASTSTTQFGNVATAAVKPVEPIHTLQSTMDSMKAPNVSPIVSAYGSIASAADKAREAAEKASDAIKDINQADKGGSKSGSGKNSGLGKAGGGPVSMGQGYLIGENGPEFFVPGSNGVIIPNHAISNGGTRGSLYGGGSEIDYDKLAAALARQPIVVEMNGQIVAEIVRGELIATSRRNGGIDVLEGV